MSLFKRYGLGLISCVALFVALVGAFVFAAPVYAAGEEYFVVGVDDPNNVVVGDGDYIIVRGGDLAPGPDQGGYRLSQGTGECTFDSPAAFGETLCFEGDVTLAEGNCSFTMIVTLGAISGGGDRTTNTHAREGGGGGR